HPPRAQQPAEASEAAPALRPGRPRRLNRRHPMSATAPPAADLIPVRALNQVTYCPRLYYLQYVDCVMPTNEHVESGLFDHRRVDDPGLAHRTRKDGDAARTRGVQLSSEALGISGVLDLVEERDGEQY